MVSTKTGTSTDYGAFKPTDTLYVDWAVINNGNAATGNSFQVTLKVDGVVKNTWPVSALDANASSLITDYSIGSLGVGSYTLSLTIDSADEITESDESDNVATENIKVELLPDLAISGTPTVTPSTVAPGGQVTLSGLTIINQGEADVGIAFLTEYFIIPSISGIGTWAPTLGTTEHLPLAVGESFPLEATLTIPVQFEPAAYDIHIHTGQKKIVRDDQVQ